MAKYELYTLDTEDIKVLNALFLRYEGEMNHGVLREKKDIKLSLR